MHNSETKSNSTEEFLTGSIPGVVIKNALPAVIAMIMVVVYNLADTVFISLTGDDYQMAAVAMGAPVFMIFMSLGTLFGVGGTSVISRALGNGDTKRASSTNSFCMWSSAAIGVLLTVVLWIFVGKLAIGLGATENTLEYATTYLKITIGCGAFSMVANCLSNLLRAEGQAIIYIPLLFIMKSIMGCDGLIWAQPVCDVISIVIIAVMVIKKLKKTVWNG